MFESVEDHRVVEQAMTLTETLAFADRLLPTLSGGETQRVHVAAALAQQPRILLLDEPTASLDLQHQLAIFAILSDRTRHDGLTTVIVSHDVNLAARFCSHVLLLNDGKSVALGPPERVLAPSVLEPVYSVKLMALSVPGCPDRRWLVPRDAPSEPGP
jgi:iron complex transport system ATP-binding protein